MASADQNLNESPALRVPFTDSEYGIDLVKHENVGELQTDTPDRESLRVHPI